jgi:hypothetical protein
MFERMLLYRRIPKEELGFMIRRGLEDQTLSLQPPPTTFLGLKYLSDFNPGLHTSFLASAAATTAAQRERERWSVPEVDQRVRSRRWVGEGS